MTFDAYGPDRTWRVGDTESSDSDLYCRWATFDAYGPGRTHGCPQKGPHKEASE